MRLLKAAWIWWGHWNNALALWGISFIQVLVGSMLTGVATIFWGALEGRSPGDALLFALSVAALVAVIIAAVGAARNYWRASGTKVGQTERSPLSIEIAAESAQIGDYDQVCGVKVKNDTGKKIEDCLVQLEQMNFPPPKAMPVPTVLRTRGQIDDNRKGRFDLSKDQEKLVPIAFADPVREIDWYIFDEQKNKHLIPRRHMQFVISFYGGEFSTKALLSVDAKRDPVALLAPFPIEPAFSVGGNHFSALAEHFPDIRVADDDRAIALFQSIERDKLFPLLESEKIDAWARPMGYGEPAPIKVPGNVWRTHQLHIFPATGPNQKNQTFVKTAGRQDTTYYDLWLNSLQLAKVWPQFRR
jgi:hypothetical protein